MNSAVLLAFALLPAIAAPKSPWLTDYAAAREIARQADKPLFVVVRCPQ